MERVLAYTADFLSNRTQIGTKQRFSMMTAGKISTGNLFSLYGKFIILLINIDIIPGQRRSDESIIRKG